MYSSNIEHSSSDVRIHDHANKGAIPNRWFVTTREKRYFWSDRTDRQKRDGFQVTWQTPASERTIVTVLILENSSILTYATYRPKNSFFSH